MPNTPARPELPAYDYAEKFAPHTHVVTLKDALAWAADERRKALEEARTIICRAHSRIEADLCISELLAKEPTT